MKNFRKIITVLLACSMLVSSVNINVFADDFYMQELNTVEEDSSVRVNDTSSDEVKAVGDNVIGNLLADEINNSQEHIYGASGAENEYKVTDLTVDRKNVKVKYFAASDACIIVGVYDDEGLEFYDSKTVGVKAENSEVTVVFDKELPDHFLLKAFIVEESTMAPLSDVFECNTYTELMQEFYAKKTSDFPEKDVVNLDSNDDSNFIVFNDDIKLFTYNPKTGANKVVVGTPSNTNAKSGVAKSVSVENSASDDEDVLSVSDDEDVLGVSDEVLNQDEEILGSIVGDAIYDGLLTVVDAEAELLNSKTGDLVCISQDGEAFLFEIGKVKSKNKTSISFEPKKVSFEQVFDFVDIDTTKIETKAGNVSTGLEGTWGAVVDFENKGASGNASLTNTLRFDLAELAEKYDQDDFGITDGNVNIKNSISGDLTVKSKVEFKFAYAKASSWFDESVKSVRLTVDNDIEAHVNFTSAISFELPLGSYPIYPIPCVGIVIEPSVILEAEMTVDVTVTQSSRIGFEVNNDGYTDLSNNDSPHVSKFSAEGRLYVGLRTTLKIGITVPLGTTSAEVLTINVSGELGIEGKVKLYINGISDEQKCCCKSCLDGDISIVAKVSVSLGVFTIPVDLATPDPVKLKVLDFYNCLDTDCIEPKFEFKECPHRKYVLKFHVKDEKGKSLQGASVKGGVDSKKIETKTTDEAGNVEFEVRVLEGSGEVTFKAAVSKTGYGSANVEVAADGDKEAEVVLEENPITLKLTFKEKGSGKVIAGLEISGTCNTGATSGTVNIEGETDSKGVFTTNVKKGYVVLTGESAAYEKYTFDEDVQANVTRTVNLERVAPDYSWMLHYSIGSNGHIYSYDPVPGGNLNLPTYDGYSGAASIAESHGGHLVTITDGAENEIVTNLAVNHSNLVSAKPFYYLGAQYDGQWKWVTGEAFGYDDAPWAGNANLNPPSNYDLSLAVANDNSAWWFPRAKNDQGNLLKGSYKSFVLIEWDEYSRVKPAEILPLLDPKKLYEGDRSCVTTAGSESINSTSMSDSELSGEFVLTCDNQSTYVADVENILSSIAQPTYKLYKNEDTGLCTIEASGAEPSQIYNIYGVERDADLSFTCDINFNYVNQIKTCTDGTFEINFIPKQLEKEIIYLFVPKSAVGTSVAEDEKLINPEEPAETGSTDVENGDEPAQDPSNTHEGVVNDKSGFWVSHIEDQIYINKVLKPKPNVYYGRTKLVEGVDYSLSYKNTKNVSISSNALNKQPAVIVTGRGNFKDKKTVYFAIKQGNKKETEAALAKYNDELKEAKVKITLNKENVVIKADELKNGVTIAKGGAKFEPVIYYKNGTRQIRLYKGKDYTIKFSNNTKAVSDNALYQALTKKPTVTITGKGKYRGSVKETYVIKHQDIGNLILAVSGGSGTSPNNYVTKAWVYDLDGKLLTAGTDYEKAIEYVSVDKPNAVLNPNAPKNEKYTAVRGEKIRVSIKGKGNYVGTISKEYLISDRRFNSTGFNSVSKEFINANVKVSEAEIMEKWKKNSKLPTPKFSIDESSYMNNVNKGTAMVVISGKDSYSGDLVYKFKIMPRSIK